jgi:hypothetical protein
MLRALKFSLFLLIHITVAVIGTGILVSALFRVIPSHSISAMVWKEFLLSIVCAGFIGFGMWRTWRSSAANWTWVLPTLWFAFAFLARRGDVWGGLFSHHSGSVLEVSDTKIFAAFTVPLIRAAFYSVGAYISSLLYSEPVTSAQ